MRKYWQLEFSKFIGICLTGALFGWSLNIPWAGAFLCLFLYTNWLLLYLKALADWLDSPNDETLPESTGLWGIVFDKIYHQKKRQKGKIKKLKKAVEMSRSSSNAIADAVVLLDKDNLLDWWNIAAKRLLGLRRRTDRHQSIYNLLRDPNFIEYFEKGEYLKGIFIPSPNNPDITLHITAAFFGRKNRIIIARDVTRLHHLEQMQKDFVANVSHELRTPLTVIKGYLETFLDYIDPDMPINLENSAILHRGLTQLAQQSQRMELLVDDLLLLSKLETDSTTTSQTTVNISLLLEQICQDASIINAAKSHTIQLSTDKNLNLIGNNKELHSAFSNIIVNAVKYTPQKGHIDIHWQKDKQGAHLSIKDNGIGINTKHIPRLTERFYRVDPSRQTKSGGTGLGLAVVKHALRHHNGHLEIQSTPGEGSNFICHFPKHRISQDNPENTLL